MYYVIIYVRIHCLHDVNAPKRVYQLKNMWKHQLMFGINFMNRMNKYVRSHQASGKMVVSSNLPSYTMTEKTSQRSTCRPGLHFRKWYNSHIQRYYQLYVNSIQATHNISRSYNSNFLGKLSLFSLNLRAFHFTSLLCALQYWFSL